MIIVGFFPLLPLRNLIYADDETGVPRKQEVMAYKVGGKRNKGKRRERRRSEETSTASCSVLW